METGHSLPVFTQSFSEKPVLEYNGQSLSASLSDDRLGAGQQDMSQGEYVAHTASLARLGFFGTLRRRGLRAGQPGNRTACPARHPRELAPDGAAGCHG